MSSRKIGEFWEHLTSIFSWRCVVLSGAAVLATFACMKAQWLADYPMALIGTAVIFPIVFAINSAYQRRELALGHYARIKSNLRALYFALTGWNGPLPRAAEAKLQDLLSRPLFAIRDLITNPIDDLRCNERAIYDSFSKISECTETITVHKKIDAPRAKACHDYIQCLMGEFEELKHIFQYRTPRALQAFSDVFITVLPILYAPVFAAIAVSIDNWYLAFLVPALFAFVLSALDNIQADLEDPFDGIGVDDIVINAELFRDSLNTPAQSKLAQTAVERAAVQTPPLRDAA